MFENDFEYTDYKIKEVNQFENEIYFSVLTDSGFAFFVENKNNYTLPQVGDNIRVFGKGQIGYPIRGALSNGNLYFYLTPEQVEENHKKYLKNIKEEKERKWSENKESFYERLNKLPVQFKERIQFFMRNENWAKEFGEYELFVCEEALKIFDKLKEESEIARFQGLLFKDQRELIPELSEDHSGNTFGAAICFAIAYSKIINGDNSINIRELHGVLCPLVGCDEYGCYAAELKKDLMKND